MKRNVLIIDSCNFSRSAIVSMAQSENYNVECLRLPEREVCSLVHGGVPDAIIINLRSVLARQFSVLRSLVLFFVREMYEGTVGIITDMTLICAQALLRIAGLPDSKGQNIYTVPSRLSPDEMQHTLMNIIAGTPTLKSVTAHEFNLTPLRLISLKSMIDGLSESQQARIQNCPIKSVYNHRNAVLQQLGVSGKHAFLCGTFL